MAVTKNMAEPALREQLSNYIARRVTTQAEALVEIYGACETNDWQNTQNAQQLLDASEKLAKLAKKLPHKPFVESAQKLSSLLKLGNIEDKPSHKALSGMAQAIQQIKQQLEIEALLSEKQPSFKLSHICLALKDKNYSEQIIHSFTATNVSALDDNCEDFEPGTCFVIDVDYQKKQAGFSLAEKLLTKHPSTAVIFTHPTELEFKSRLLAIRHKSEAIITGKLTAQKLTRAINTAFGTSLDCKPLIAVIDDSLSQLKYAENALINSNFDCITIGESTELLNSLELHEPDLLLLDMYLPDSTGIEIAKLLKQHPRWRNLPVIFMSAEEDPAIVEEAEVLSNAPFLTKPVKPAKLAKEINKLLKAK